MPATGASAISNPRPSERYLTSGVDGDGRRLVRSLRNKPPLALLYDLAPPIHNANARELQRDVDSDIVFHGCPPSKMPGADSTSRPRFIIYRGTATFTARSVQGPLRHLVSDKVLGVFNYKTRARRHEPLRATCAMSHEIDSKEHHGTRI